MSALLHVAETAKLHRNYFVSLGHLETDCAVGHYDGTTRLADDTGAVDYTLNERGQILSRMVGHPGRLIETIRIQMSADISRYNSKL